MLFEPRTHRLIYETNLITRILIGSAIVVGLVMRKAIYGQLSALFAFREYSHVTDFKDFYSGRSEIKTIITFEPLLYQLIKKKPIDWNRYKLEYVENPYSLETVSKFMNNEAVFSDDCNILKPIKSRYSFLPLFLGIYGKRPSTLNFPVFKHSLYFKEIYLILQRAIETGITVYAKTQTEGFDIVIDKENIRKVYLLYQKSTLFTRHYHKETNVLMLSKYLWLSGIGIALVFLCKELWWQGR